MADRQITPLEHIDTHLTLLVSIGKDLQTVSGDGQELWVCVFKQRNNLLQTVTYSHRHLGTILVEQEVMECSDGVK